MCVPTDGRSQRESSVTHVRMSLRHGQALAIDLDMCDVSLPQEYPDHVRDSSSGKWSPSFRFLAEFTKMSILLGRACGFMLIGDLTFNADLCRSADLFTYRPVQSRRRASSGPTDRDRHVGQPAAEELALFTDPVDPVGGGFDEHLLRGIGGEQFSVTTQC